MLRIVGLKPAGRELFNAEGASEEAAGVARPFQLNEPSITEPCWVKLHGTRSRMFSDDAVCYSMALLCTLGRLDHRPYMNFGHLAVGGRLSAFQYHRGDIHGLQQKLGR